MRSLEKTTRGLREAGRKALVPFLTAGFPDPETSLTLLRAAVDEGCPVIEIGVPFSDPVADGPVIQRASQQALEQGMTLRKAFEWVGVAAEGGARPVMMTYLNPILRQGPEEFAREAAAAGCAGVIVPDLGFEETGPLREVLAGQDIALIDLAAPTTPDGRLAGIAGQAAGFLYLVAILGVTGTAAPVAGQLARFAARVRRTSDVPAYAGFGIDGPERAVAAASACDGVIMGSSLLRCFLEEDDPGRGLEAARDLLHRTRRALETAGEGDPT